MYNFFFQLLEIMKNNNNNNEKKKLCRTVFGLLPNYIVNLYCKPCNCIASLAIVLQERGLKKIVVKKIILQGSNCIAEKKRF